MRLENKYRVRHERLPLSAFITHPQMRVTFNEESINSLAENIFLHGLIHPLCVAETSEGFLIISGHRRYRALQKLAADGRFNGKVEVTIFSDLSSVEIALLQASENIHEQVPPHEAARFYEITWKLIKVSDPNFTLSNFAKAVGRSEETIRSALKFCLLPKEIQDLVEANLLSYGVAVQLARLRDSLDANELIRWAIHSIAANDKVSAVKERVNIFLRDQKSEQSSLLDIFGEKAREELERSSKRLTLNIATIRAFWSMNHYFSRILSLIETGKLGKQDSPFSMKSTLKAFRHLIKNLERLLPHLQSFLSQTEYHEAKKILQGSESLADQLEKKEIA